MQGWIIGQSQQVLISNGLDVEVERCEVLLAGPLENDSRAIRRDCWVIGPSGKSRERDCGEGLYRLGLTPFQIPKRAEGDADRTGREPSSQFPPRQKGSDG
jgi:hypothetical protein